MEDLFDYLIQTIKRFQKQNLLDEKMYLYIAPMDVKLYKVFYEKAHDKTASSMYYILSHPNAIKEILISNFLDNIELDIYITINDEYFPISDSLTLQEYCENKGIDFEYNRTIN